MLRSDPDPTPMFFRRSAMNVYSVNATARRGGKAEYYPCLHCTKPAERFLRRDDFRGLAFARRWRAIKLYADEPRPPRPDFYYFILGVIVCNEKAKSLVGPL